MCHALMACLTRIASASALPLLSHMNSRDGHADLRPGLTRPRLRARHLCSSPLQGPAPALTCTCTLGTKHGTKQRWPPTQGTQTPSTGNVSGHCERAGACPAEPEMFPISFQLSITGNACGPSTEIKLCSRMAGLG